MKIPFSSMCGIITLGRNANIIKSATFVLVFALLSVAGWPNAAPAAVVTAIPGGTVITMPTVNYQGTGPQTFGTPSITWTSTQPDAVFGYSGSNALGVNGTWNGLIEAATNASGTGSMTFTFSSPVTSVGAFINYAQNFNRTNQGSISVFNASNALIESDTFIISTPGATNGGSFFGFSESTPISSFTLTGFDIAATNLTIASPVPEPTSWAMMILGFLGLGVMAYRKKKTTYHHYFMIGQAS